VQNASIRGQVPSPPLRGSTARPDCFLIPGPKRPATCGKRLGFALKPIQTLKNQSFKIFLRNRMSEVGVRRLGNPCAQDQTQSYRRAKHLGWKIAMCTGCRRFNTVNDPKTTCPTIANNHQLENALRVLDALDLRPAAQTHD